jgi:hypothetical protein
MHRAVNPRVLAHSPLFLQTTTARYDIVMDKVDSDRASAMEPHVS